MNVSTETAGQCLALVRKREPFANGVTYSVISKRCFAEFSATSVCTYKCPGVHGPCSSCKACVFSGRLTRILINDVRS